MSSIFVRVGDEIIVIKDGRRAAKARQRFAGHHLRVGVQVRHQNIALHQRPGKLHPRSAEGLVGFISIYLPVVQGKTYMTAVVFRNNKV